MRCKLFRALVALAALTGAESVAPVVAAINPNCGRAELLIGGPKDATADGIGRNDTRLTGDTTPTIFAAIASSTIEGTVPGSSTNGAFFGLTAERLVKLTVGRTGTKFVAAKGEDLLLDPTHADFRAVDFA